MISSDFFDIPTLLAVFVGPLLAFFVVLSSTAVACVAPPRAPKKAQNAWEVPWFHTPKRTRLKGVNRTKPYHQSVLLL